MKYFGTLTCIILFALSIAGQQRKPDREVDGYKGAVKRIVTERADLKLLKGKHVETKRRLAEDTEYDAAGNRSRQLSYDYLSGQLSERANYKMIDGDSTVAFDVYNTPGSIVATMTEAPTTTKSSDPRYDYKFKYKTDAAGNVTEKAWWASNGDLWLRYVYSVSGNEKTELVYSEDGELNQKYVYKLDASGNEREMIIYDTDTDRPSERVMYKYLTFDARGNWTKRSETAGDEEHNFKQRPREMTYRKITYYVGGR
jgi:hypothetical protein